MKIGIRSNESITALRIRYAAIAENRQLNLSIKTLDVNGKALEERFYQSAGVQEIILPVMDAADRNIGWQLTSGMLFSRSA